MTTQNEAHTEQTEYPVTIHSYEELMAIGGQYWERRYGYFVLTSWGQRRLAKTKSLETAARLVRNNRMRVHWVSRRKDLEKYTTY